MVNTFLPYSDYTLCAKSLDNKRLGKQRVEAKQILDIISRLKDKPDYIAWRNHPAVLMWKNYPESLMLYYNSIVLEWVRRGFKNNMPLFLLKTKPRKPWFIGIKTFHLSFQANLIRKDSEYKKQFKVPAKFIKYTYIWPSKLSAEQRRILKTNKDSVLDIAQFTSKIKK